MRRLVCTAEPFGYGPSSSLAQIVSRMRTLATGEIEASYVGSGHTLDFMHEIDAYGGRVEAGGFGDRVARADAALIVTDFEAAEAARRAGVPFAIYDPLAWYWSAIPEVCRAADLYIVQDFFGVRQRVAEAGLENAVIVPPLTPEVPAAAERSGMLISLGGLGNPYFTQDQCADYARAVLAALRRAIADEPGGVTSLTSKQIAESLHGLEVATLPPDEVHRRIAAARVCFLTPGLGQLYEAAALGARVVWLPPANDSQGRQLREVVAHDMTSGAIDWHQVLDVPRVDYRAPQEQVMRTLSSHMERLLHEPRAQARLAAVARARMLAVREAASDPLAQLVVEHGRGGAVVAGRILDNWLRSLPSVERTRRLGEGVALARPRPPSSPRSVPLTVPRENRAGDEIVEPLRALHAEVNGRGFHTLGAALEVLAETRRSSKQVDFVGTLARWRGNGLALWEKYRAGNCTVHAEVLRQRILRELGLSSHILCVRYADSARPLDHVWEYTGTVHSDLLVPFVDGDRTRAVHVVCGMGVTGHFHVFDDEAALFAHLDGLGYLRGAVVDAGELTRVAFGIKRKWWIVEGPEVGDASPKLGVDVVDGTVFLNGAASARHRGPRPMGEGNIAVPLSWAIRGGTREIVMPGGTRARLPSADALRTILDAFAHDFAQPPDFTDNLVFLGTHLDAWCEATLCEPGPSLRAGRRRTSRRYDEPSHAVIAMLDVVDAGGDPLATAREGAADVPRAVVVRRVREHVRAMRALPRSAVRARHAMAAELVRLAAVLPPRAPEAAEPDVAPSVLDPDPPAADDDTMGGVRFDPDRQVYVPAQIARTVVHALHLRLAQFLEWELEGLDFVAGRALVHHLVERATDPGTGRSLVDADRIASIVEAIADAAHADDGIAKLGQLPVDVWLTASAGGDQPERIDWALPPATIAALYALLDDARRCGRLFAVAEAARAAAEAIVERQRTALAAVLEQHRGVPRRHKRVHWAFVNLAVAGQTTIEMRGPHGILPRDATLLEPATVATRYADAPRTALRFVLTDRFEINVLGDQRYWETIRTWGFPPNHELLAATRPILASGYLTIESGAIVAIEDDGVMIPGKLGAQLPPIQEVLEALGYPIDLARVGGASLVIDWDAFAEAATRRLDAPAIPDTMTLAEYLASRSHAERPAIVVAWIRGLGADLDATVRATAAGLRGFRLINVSGRAMAAGELPKGAEWIDETLARYLVRKVVTP